MPAYHRLDLAYRLRYEYKHWTFCPYVELINVYGRKNPLTVYYDTSTNPATKGYAGQLPFLPSVGFTAEF
jgi:hypothetical protein